MQNYRLGVAAALEIGKPLLDSVEFICSKERVYREQAMYLLAPDGLEAEACRVLQDEGLQEQGILNIPSRTQLPQSSCVALMRDVMGHCGPGLQRFLPRVLRIVGNAIQDGLKGGADPASMQGRLALRCICHAHPELVSLLQNDAQDLDTQLLMAAAYLAAADQTDAAPTATAELARAVAAAAAEDAVAAASVCGIPAYPYAGKRQVSDAMRQTLSKMPAEHAGMYMDAITKHVDPILSELLVKHVRGCSLLECLVGERFQEWHDEPADTVVSMPASDVIVCMLVRDPSSAQVMQRVPQAIMLRLSKSMLHSLDTLARGHDIGLLFMQYDEAAMWSNLMSLLRMASGGGAIDTFFNVLAMRQPQPGQPHMLENLSSIQPQRAQQIRDDVQNGVPFCLAWANEHRIAVPLPSDDIWLDAGPPASASQPASDNELLGRLPAVAVVQVMLMARAELLPEGAARNHYLTLFQPQADYTWMQCMTRTDIGPSLEMMEWLRDAADGGAQVIGLLVQMFAVQLAMQW